MIGHQRLTPWIVCAVLVVALPAFGTTTVSAAAPASGAGASPDSHSAPASRAVPFLPLTSHERTATGRHAFKPGGGARASLRGRSTAASAILGQAAAAGRPVASHLGKSGPLITPTAPDNLTGFAGIAQASAIHNFGSNEEITPPDEDIAVGPTDIVQVVNSAVYVFNRSGAVLGAADLNRFMFVTPGYSSTDPRVIYDTGGSRFWITITEVPTSFTGCPASQPVLIAVSPSSNPLPFAGWLVYALPMKVFGGTTGQPLTEFGDQPGLGVASNTITVTWSDYACNLNFNGSEVDVLQKTDYEHNTGNTSVYFFYNGPPAPQPVQAIGSMSVSYVLDNQSDCAPSVCASPAAEVDEFTGTPEGSGGVTSLPPIDVPMAPTLVDGTTFSTPPADQPPPGPTLQTDDDRFLNAVWQGGEIWTADDTSCMPTGDTVLRSCLNYIEIGADGAGTVNSTLTNQINNFGVNGAALFYPAVSVDSSGNLFTVFNESSTTMLPSIMAATLPSGGTTLSSFQTLHTSSTYYNAGPCGSGCRWGDYAGAAQDPANPKDVWVVSGSADGSLAAPCTLHSCWNTRINQLTLAGPTITSLTPNSGPVAGGQTVTVGGFDFASDTTVTFAGTPIAISALTPESFTFVTPLSATAGGIVQTQATDSLGASTMNSASSYTYVGLANYTPVSPIRILDTRSGAGSPLGPGTIRTLAVPTTVVPSVATAVVLNMTEVNGAAASLLTVYPYATTKPNASNLNFLAHTVIANLVTVSLGPGGRVNIYNAAGSVNVLADVEGYFTPQPVTDVLGLFHPIAPVRVCDTRATSLPNGCRTHGILVGGTPMVVNMTAGGAIPSDGTAEAAILNLTGVAGSASTFLSVFPTSSNGTCQYNASNPPKISTLNLLALAVQANRVMVKLGPASFGAPTTSVCVYAAVGKINVLLDANGWYGSATAPATPAGYQYQAVGPSRICDTRAGSASCTKAVIGAAVSRLIGVAGHGGVPPTSGATIVVAVIANLTAVVPTAATYLTLYPANLLRKPGASDLNVNAGVTLPNLAVVQLDTMGDAHDGEIYLYNSAGSVNAIIDIEGWFQ
jgi:IPT/TIG domain-containing protein